MRAAQKNLSRSAIAIGACVLVLVVELTERVAHLLVSAINDSNRNGASDVAPGGGVLNFRTAQLDDGTDPVGWYEKD